MWHVHESVGMVCEKRQQGKRLIFNDIPGKYSESSFTTESLNSFKHRVCQRHWGITVLVPIGSCWDGRNSSILVGKISATDVFGTVGLSSDLGVNVATVSFEIQEFLRESRRHKEHTVYCLSM